MLLKDYQLYDVSKNSFLKLNQPLAPLTTLKTIKNKV